MKRNDPECWTRLKLVIDRSGKSVNEFAHLIGLPRGENLYQIKRGNNGISIDVAMRINCLYPRYSISWLMCGQKDAEPVSDCAVRIPLFRSIDQPGLSEGESAQSIFLSPELAGHAEAAVNLTDEALLPGMRNPLVLLRRVRPDEPILYGNFHLAVLARERLFRIVSQGETPDELLLCTTRPGPNDIRIDRKQIESLWLACTVIAGLIK